MRRLAITLTMLTIGVAACSSSGGNTATKNTTAKRPSTSTTVVTQPEQHIPPRTRYVIDGQDVDLICRGHGRIPVVFQAGGRESGVVWNHLIASIGDNAFSCIFNRPGTTAETVGQPVHELTTPDIVADSLSQTLRAAHVGPRVILVGHSAGGTDSIVFGARYPDQVAGAVLFDPSVPALVPSDEWKRIGFDAAKTMTETRTVSAWRNVPLVILTADPKLAVANDGVTPADEAAWIAGHQRWAHLSPQGTQRAVPNTSHFVYLTAPTVARDSIREVLADALSSTNSQG